MLTTLLLAAVLTPVLVKDIQPGTIAEKVEPDFFAHAAIGNVVFFQTMDGLWRTDGTAPGTHRVYDGLLDHRRGFPAGVTAAGDRVFFPINTW
ncbi:MAG: hypothetical protein ACLGH0_12660, partial [Thermoanaerobaculia bacterium]